MSDKKDENPPDVDIPRPDIPPPPVDSLGRSMAKKRGRKPGTQGANPPDAAKQLQKEINKRLPSGAAMSDENVGKALAGAFAAIALFRGGHWRLFAQEERELGSCFGPLARLHGPEELAKWVTILMTIPVATAVLMPRIGVERMIMKGEIEKGEGRVTILRIRALMQAESMLDAEQQKKEAAKLEKEAADYLQAQQEVGRSVANDLNGEKVKSEGVLDA